LQCVNLYYNVVCCGEQYLAVAVYAELLGCAAYTCRFV